MAKNIGHIQRDGASKTMGTFNKYYQMHCDKQSRNGIAKPVAFGENDGLPDL